MFVKELEKPHDAPRFRFNEGQALRNRPVAYFSEGARLPRGQMVWEPTVGSSRAPLKMVYCEQTGNYYYGARYYDPKICVWLSVDPLHDKRSWLAPYNFVQNNPLLRIDPNGLTDYLLDPKTGKTSVVPGSETTDGDDRVIADLLPIYDFETGELLNEDEKVFEVKRLGAIKKTVDVVFDKETGISTKEGQRSKMDIYSFGPNDSKAQEFYEFMANNSEVEFDYTRWKSSYGSNSFVSTLFSDQFSGGASYFDRTLNPDYTLQFGSFSHPLGGNPGSIDVKSLRSLSPRARGVDFKIYYPRTQSYSRPFNSYSRF